MLNNTNYTQTTGRINNPVIIPTDTFKIVSHGKVPTKNQIMKFTLPLSVQKEFEKFCISINKNPYDNPEYFYKVMESKLKSIFPETLTQAIQEMGKNGNIGMLLIDGFPIDSAIPKKSDYDDPLDRRDAKTKVSEAAMLAITSLMQKHLQSNPKEHNGAVIHQISPTKTKYLTASSQGIEPVIYHVENPFEKQPANFLILTCLEGDTQASTAYFFVNDFVNNLPENIVQSMKKNDFTIRSGASYDDVEINRLPLLSEDADTRKLQLRLHEVLCDRFQPLTEEARNTIDYLNEKLSTVRHNDEYITGSVSLQKGQVLIFNNAWGIGKIDGIMHARDGKISNVGRWLQRGFMYENTKKDDKKILDGHAQALSDILKSKNIPLSEASSHLRAIMLSTDSAKEYAQNNPNATQSQITLYGTKPQNLAKMVAESHKNGL